MKKVIKRFFSIFIFIVMISCLGVFADDDTPATPNADSKSVISLNVSARNNLLFVNGETEEGMLAVAVAVYDKSGKNLVTMQTAAVDDDNYYECSIELEDGHYLVKVADYQGGNYLTKSITIGDPDKKPSKEKEKDKNKDNKKTEDKNTDNTDEFAGNNDETGKNQTETVYFPKTGDDESYIWILSGLAIISMASCFALTKNIYS